MAAHSRRQRCFVTTARNAVADRAGSARELRVTVIPPRIRAASRPRSTIHVQVHALEGSTVRLELVGVSDLVQLIEPGREPRDSSGQRHGATRVAGQRVARAADPAANRRGDGADRLLQLQVQPDQRPAVTIEQPARDMLFGDAEGRVPVRIVARDDLNLASLVLRFTRIAGSGETFTFQEGSSRSSIQVPRRLRPRRGAAME